MLKKNLLISLLLISNFTFAQLNPTVISWIINTNSLTGYGGILSNVQQVQYSDSNVYVSCTCIPGYDIGPWQGNPNTPSNQNFVFKITRNPQQNTGTPINTSLGHIGVWTNGVSIFNPKDAFSYQNQNVWHQNAIVVEGGSFDNCLGHPAPNGEYHHHLNPTCLYDDSNATAHSPIIGFAFDGFPIYGAYGFADTNGTGGIKRMNSSFRMRNISTRTTLPDGSTASFAGPDVSATYPLGYYIEDFEFVTGLGDLDEHNGRFCITPEYPSGIYAYFVTLDSTLQAAYPYVLGLQYYGTVQSGNTGPGSGQNTITESVTTYTVSGINEKDKSIIFQAFPNPSSDFIHIFVEPGFNNNLNFSLVDLSGKEIFGQKNIQPTVDYSFDIKNLPNGIYILKLQSENYFSASKFIKQ